MTLNLCQSIILLCIIQGVLYISILLLSKDIRTKANLYLALLILALTGNLLQYWLRDVNLITDHTLQLLFLPWQILIAPFFWFYIRELQIFKLQAAPNYILWGPIGFIVGGHLIIKVYLLSTNSISYVLPEWVELFNLAEEYISMIYCIIVSVAAFLIIRNQRKTTNYQGFGINQDIVILIRNLAILGVVLCIIWFSSLMLFDIGSISNYYFLWIFSGIILNVMGLNGIYNSLKQGPYVIAQLPIHASASALDPTVEKGSNSNIKLSVASPKKYFNQNLIDGLIWLSTNLSTVDTAKDMRTMFKEWLLREFKISDVTFLSELSSLHLKGIAQVSSDKLHLTIPYRNRDRQLSAFEVSTLGQHSFDQQHLYYLKMAAKAYSFHLGELKSSKTNIASDNPHFIQISSWMRQEELFKDPQLDLSALAIRLDISDGYLSKMINEISGRHFNDWLNGYRINHAKELMSNSGFDHYSITGYGYESGFNSKSTFYKAFQKQEGVSPGTYKKGLIKGERAKES